MMKKFLSVFLCVIIIMSASLTAVAESSQSIISTPDDLVVQPYFTYINSGITSLGFISGQAHCYAFILGYSMVNKVSITMRLQKKGFLGLYWTTVKTWSQTFNSNMGDLYSIRSVSKGTYRVRADYVAYSGSASESHTGHSPEVKY